MHRTRWVVATAVAVGSFALAVPPAVAADGPGVGAATVVTLGDSYISGEAGRWAGNSNSSASSVDALGSTAYFDNAAGNAEQIANCHRSKAAEVFIGGGVRSVNLACSGAKTATSTSGDFKPGIDFYTDSSGRAGQAAMLRDVARTSNVKLVVVSIGGNDFKFADIVTACLTNFLTSPSWWPNYCYDDSSVKANFTTTNVTTIRNRISVALQNVRQAMRDAGYADGSYTLAVQTYPSPIPNGSGFRYSQSGYTRQSTGGCGFWNKDADWANSTALTTINATVRAAVTQSGVSPAVVLDLQSAFNGRRLCESTVGLREEKGLDVVAVARGGRPRRSGSRRSGPSARSAARTTCRSRCTPTTGRSRRCSPACGRSGTAAVGARGGACVIGGTGLVDGEPVMRLQ